MDHTLLTTRCGEILARNLTDELETVFDGVIIGSPLRRYQPANDDGGICSAQSTGIIAQCLKPHDVLQAVRFARAYDLKTAVRRGSEGPTHQQGRDGDFVIDLSRMKKILIDPRGSTVEVEVSVTFDQLDKATAPLGLFVPAGRLPKDNVRDMILHSGVAMSVPVDLLDDEVVGFKFVTCRGFPRSAEAVRDDALFRGLYSVNCSDIITAIRFKARRLNITLRGGLSPSIEQTIDALRYHRRYQADNRGSRLVYDAAFQKSNSRSPLGR